MEMEPVPGYEATSWEAGYGDYTMRPDLATLRLIPWLEGTALVLCDVLDHHGHAEVPHSPRAILKRQRRPARERGLKAYMASELEFFLFDQTYRRCPRLAATATSLPSALQRGLPPLPDHARRRR